MSLTEPQTSILTSFLIHYSLVIQSFSGFGGLEVSVLAYGTQVRGLKPGKKKKKKSSARLPSEEK
jgi:hypothetical protein